MLPFIVADIRDGSPGIVGGAIGGVLTFIISLILIIFLLLITFCRMRHKKTDANFCSKYWIKFNDACRTQCVGKFF